MIQLNVSLLVYLILTILLLETAFVVFRRIVREDYLRKGSLSGLASTLQLIVFAGVFCYPYLYNPPEWPWFWKLEGPTSIEIQIAGLVLILAGFLIAFGTMAWFGLRRAFGLNTDGMIINGPYRWSRNPQILGGYLLVLGTAVQWPSGYACIWVLLYGMSGHWMIKTEEEYLIKQFGEEFERYCSRTPRYLFKL